MLALQSSFMLAVCSRCDWFRYQSTLNYKREGGRKAKEISTSIPLKRVDIMHSIALFSSPSKLSLSRSTCANGESTYTHKKSPPSDKLHHIQIAFFAPLPTRHQTNILTWLPIPTEGRRRQQIKCKQYKNYKVGCLRIIHTRRKWRKKALKRKPRSKETRENHQVEANLLGDVYLSHGRRWLGGYLLNPLYRTSFALSLSTIVLQHFARLKVYVLLLYYVWRSFCWRVSLSFLSP